MGRYVREIQLMLTSMANIPLQTNIWDQDQTAPMRSGSILIASKTSFNNELVDDIMARYVRKMQLMHTSLWTWIRLLLGEQFNPDPHCLLQRLDWNNLAEHKWRFAGVLMMAQHCWLSTFLIFQGILISIAKKPYISYDFSVGGGSGAPAPPPPPLDHRIMNTPN